MGFSTLSTNQNCHRLIGTLCSRFLYCGLGNRTGHFNSGLFFGGIHRRIGDRFERQQQLVFRLEQAVMEPA